MTLLCVSIFVTDLAQAKRDIARAAEAGADLVELRIDRFEEAQAVRELVDACMMPAIVTCRASWEGGESTLSDDKRLGLLEAACHGKVRYLDIELETVRRGNELPVGRPIICSFHDFEGRPARLHNIILEMNQRPCAVNKVAWTARSIRDCVEAFELLTTRSKPTIALCMGEAGVISRILAKKFGAMLTFASLDDASTTAPGQVSIEQLKKLYRWDAISEKTRVYGVVASPVKHSMSPAIHNAAFQRVGHDGVYLPLLVEGSYEAFKAFMETFTGFAPLHLSGLSVTLPHKENALRYLKEKGGQIEELAERIGAVNTIVIGAGGKLEGYNSDYAAILDSLTTNRATLKGHSIGVIGAGGTGRTAVAALRHYGAAVTVYNRTLDRAAALAGEFGCRAAGMDELPKSSHQIYLNTTSIGMSPKVDASPFDAGVPALSAGSVVFDAVYNPVETKFLQQAKAAGATTISGVEMFVRQAVRQFELWTGKEAPIDLMRQVVISRLQG
jgi:3-dehydroquinate dehydratase/shikimate dehydrogenase